MLNAKKIKLENAIFKLAACENTPLYTHAGRLVCGTACNRLLRSWVRIYNSCFEAQNRVFLADDLERGREFYRREAVALERDRRKNPPLPPYQICICKAVKI